MTKPRVRVKAPTISQNEIGEITVAAQNGMCWRFTRFAGLSAGVHYSLALYSGARNAFLKENIN